MTTSSFVRCVAGAVVTLAFGSLVASSARGAVVVEQVTPGTAAAAAGLRPGDTLRSWLQVDGRAAEGPLRTPLDLALVEIERAPRGPVTLLDAGDRRVTLPPSAWGVTTRPQLTAEDLRRYRAAEQQMREGSAEQGAATLSRLAAAASDQGRADEAAWWLLRAAELAVETDQWPLAERLFEGATGVTARAQSAADLTALVTERWAAACADRGLFETASRLHRRALELRRQSAPATLAVASSLHELGAVALRQRQLTSAEALLAEARDIRQQLAPSSLQLASTLGSLGSIARRRGELDGAEELYAQALAIRQRLAPGGVDEASSLNSLGIVAWQRGRLQVAARYLERALAIRRRLAPGSLKVAGSLTNLGGLARQRGDLDLAESRYREALSLYETQGAPGLKLASAINNLGVVAHERGDLAGAEQHYRRALALKESHAPDSLDTARTLNNLGSVTQERGDLAAAERYLERALEIKNRVAPGTVTVASTLNNLGSVARERGAPGAAEEFYSRALALAEKLSGDSAEVAMVLSNLGKVNADRGDVAAAEKFHSRALALRQVLAPQSVDVATSLSFLGELALQAGDLERAEGLFERSARLTEQIAPDSLLLALQLRGRGQVALERGQWQEAEKHFSAALAIRARLAPGSRREAQSLHDLGLLHRGAGRPAQALELFSRALTALESQHGRLGGTQRSRTSFRARHLDYYRHTLELQVSLGWPERAFRTLERSRAHGLRTMLAERDLVFAGDLPADLERERRVVAVSVDRAHDALETLSPALHQEQYEEAAARLRQLRRRQEELREEVRQRSPALADLEYPEPMDLAAATAALDAGTVLLEYAVGPESTMLFVVRGGADPGRALKTFVLSVGEARLAAEVQALRDFIAAGRGLPQEVATLKRRARRLYESLVSPAEEALADAERLLLCPDGPLLSLPFAALVRADGHYLIEWKPLHTVVSATVYGQLQQRRPDSGARPISVVAFGDPHSTGAAVGEIATALPSSRLEVQEVAAAWGDRARTFLGSEATEARAKGVGVDATVLHFACHGRLDRRFPLSSGLVLAAPLPSSSGQDNGLLQAWEVFEQMRLDANLVVLSACDTGLGERIQGEGLIGLTRAFQYAGARTVVASLWRVPDESTAVLMGGFHSGLRGGLSTDEALRQAQLRLLRGTTELSGDHGGIPRELEASHPFYWAAFQIVGDWM